MSHYYNFMLAKTDNLFDVMKEHMLSDSKYSSLRLKSLDVKKPLEETAKDKNEKNNKNDKNDKNDKSKEHDIDALFWCVYKGVYGVEKYNEIERYMNVMIEEKLKISKYFEKNKNFLKQHNKKLTVKEIKEILSNLLTNTKDYDNLYAYSVYYKRPIYLIKNNTIMKIIPHESLGEPIIIENSTYIENTKPDNYENHYELNNFRCPLKPVSQFRMNEIRNLASEFDIEPKTKTKNEIYNELNHLFMFESL